MARSGIVLTDRTLFRNLERFPGMVKVGVAADVEAQGPQVEQYMQIHAPWQDQTGAARRGLHTEVEHGPTSETMSLRGGVDYQIWLEVKFGGRDAVIRPTISVEGPRVMGTLRGLMGRI
jgi:hypothetical protein